MTPFEVPAPGITIRGHEAGTGPAVLLCHGFPETSLSWGGVLARLAAAGFRAIAPDMRGYGGTSAPPDAESYSQLHLVGDMVALLDELGLASAAIVGHDWGAQVAWNAALMRPDCFPAVAGLSVPYALRSSRNLLGAMRGAGRAGFYMLYFQEPGPAEAELDRDPHRSLLTTYVGLSAKPAGDRPFDGSVGSGGFLASLGDPGPDLPAWLDPALLDGEAAAFTQSGFRGGLNWYRNLERDWALLAPFDGAAIRQPSLFVAGKQDLVVNWNGRTIAALPRALPGLRGVHLLDDVGHWVQQEAPDRTAQLLIEFLRELP